MSLTKPTKIEINKTLAVLAVLIIAMAGVLPSLFAVKPPKTTVQATVDLSEELKKDFLKISPTISVTVYDKDGNLKSTMTKEDDLVVNNFITFLQGWFCLTNTVSKTLTNDAGVEKTIKIKSTTQANSWADSATGSGTKGGIAGIGTGTTAAARADYALETQVESDATQQATFPQYSTSTGIITSSFSFAITDTHAITEAVLACNWVASDGTENTFVLFHDVFSAVNVVNTDTLVLGYTIALNETAFTNIFGYLLMGVISTCADGGEVILPGTLIKTTGNQNSGFLTYDVAWFGYFQYSTTGNAGSPQICIGTSTGSEVRTAYKITTPVEAETNLVADATVSGGTITMYADITCVSSREITEAAIYVPMHDGQSPANEFCLWRHQFAAVSISAGQAIRITFTLAM